MVAASAVPVKTSAIHIRLQHAPRKVPTDQLIFAAVLNAEVKTGFILIPEGDAVIQNGAQPGSDTYQQQIQGDNLQPCPVHAWLPASAMPVIVCPGP